MVVTFRLDEKTEKELHELIVFLQDKSFGKVTKTDVIKVAISEMHKNYIPDAKNKKK